MATGGSILAVTAATNENSSNLGDSICSNSNYDDKLACWGTGSGDEDHLASLAYCCWDGKDNATPLKEMDDYTLRVSNENFTTAFNQMQAFWQETTDSIVIGELHLSSLLEDEEKSKMNARLANQIQEGRFKNLNLVEVNNVCDGGLSLKAALDEFNLKQVSGAMVALA